MRIGLYLHPRLLEVAYECSRRILHPFRRWMVHGGLVERIFVGAEKVLKGAIFDCQMCGDCVLHLTGMVCPVNCPKTMRNGPCGGVNLNGSCEINPEMKCVWVEAWERSKLMNTYNRNIMVLSPPLSGQLQGGSAWINECSGVAGKNPGGWT